MEGISRKSLKGEQQIFKKIIEGIKIICWNINAVNSTELGSKLHDNDVLKKLTKYDVVILVETHSDGSDLSIPNFHQPLQITRENVAKNTLVG